MHLQLSGKLNQYINLHYSYLAYISMFLSFVLALVQLIIKVKQMKIHSHLSGFWAKSGEYFLALYSFVCRAIFPYSDTGFPNSFCKGYHFPVAAGSSRKSSRTKGQQPSISNQILVAILPNLPMSQK